MTACLYKFITRVFFYKFIDFRCWWDWNSRYFIRWKKNYH